MNSNSSIINLISIILIFLALKSKELLFLYLQYFDPGSQWGKKSKKQLFSNIRMSKSYI